MFFGVYVGKVLVVCIVVVRGGVVVGSLSVVFVVVSFVIFGSNFVYFFFGIGEKKIG